MDGVAGPRLRDAGLGFSGVVPLAVATFTSSLVGVVVASPGPVVLATTTGGGGAVVVALMGLLIAGVFVSSRLFVGEAFGEAAALASLPFFGPKKEEILPTATGGDVFAFLDGGAIGAPKKIWCWEPVFFWCFFPGRGPLWLEKNQKTNQGRRVHEGNGYTLPSTERSHPYNPCMAMYGNYIHLHFG